MEENQETIVLVDEDGMEEEFIYLDTVEMSGNKYVVLMPMEPEDEMVENEEYDAEEDAQYDEEAEVVILRVEGDGEGDSFAVIEDEDELDSVYEAFLAGYEQQE